MTYRALGRSGLRVSAVSFGAWLTFSQTGQVGVDQAVELLGTCVRLGINSLDNAESYGGFPGESEYVMGLALQRLFRGEPGQPAVRRRDLVISTKLWGGGDGVNDRGLSRKHLLEGMDASLSRLRLSYVDLVFCHRPDATTPIEEVVRAMNHLVSTGKALYWGTSMWPAADLAEAHGIAARLGLVGPLMEQPEYNIFVRHRVEVEYAPLYRRHGLGLTVYSPLAEGILAGRYDSIAEGGTAPSGSRAAEVERKKGLAAMRERIAAAAALRPIAEELGCTRAQLAIAWALRNGNVSTAITGASRPEQLEQTAAAAGLRISDDTAARIDKALADNGVLAGGPADSEAERAAQLLAFRGPPA